jgi:hypothetical protein
MRKLFSNGLVVVAGTLCLAAPMAHSVPHYPPTPDFQEDPRLACLQHFFQQAACPIERFSHIFIQVADTYNLDWRLLPSISFIESTGGKMARNNNLFGWDSGKAAFSTPVAAIQEVAHQLANSSLYRNKKLDGILHTYNPDASYARKVKSVMQQIAPTETLE